MLKFIQPARVESKQVEPLRAIYFDSFPPPERGDFNDWLNEIAEGKRWLFLAEARRQIIGYATILPWVTANAHLLEYLAIASGHRNQNFGAQLFRHVAKTMRALGKADGIFWEVESDATDTGTDADAETDLRRRRVAFYARNGGEVIECAPRYRVPSLTGGEPLKMKIMWLSLREGAAPPRGQPLRECIISSYVLDYGLPADDPLLIAVLKDLEC
jgi:GNAT superfamily N-acetyltransferase